MARQDEELVTRADYECVKAVLEGREYDPLTRALLLNDWEYLRSHLHEPGITEGHLDAFAREVEDSDSLARDVEWLTFENQQLRARIDAPRGGGPTCVH